MMRRRRSELAVVVLGVLLGGCNGATTSIVDAPSSDAGGPADGGPHPPATVVCPAPAVTADFETELDPSWPVTDPTGIRLDGALPITGARSLRIAYRQQESFVTIPMPSVCSVRIAFTFRADTMLLSTGTVTIARVTAGAGSQFHLQVGSGGLLLAQELKTAGAVGLAVGMPVGSVAPDVASAVVLTVDLRTKTTSVAVAPVGEPLPSAAPGPMRVDEADPANPGPITAVDLGSARGIVSDGVGILLIDDLTID
jgi:hypothetical protein